MKTDDIEPLSTIDLDVIMKSASSIDSFKALIHAGGEFTLSNDLTLNETIEIPEGKTVTLDLDGYDITSAANVVFNVSGGTLVLQGNGEVTGARTIGEARDGGSIIINNGTYTTTGYLGFTAVGPGSKVTVNDGYIAAQEGATMAFDGASLEINGG
jgi:hypothetical protein